MSRTLIHMANRRVAAAQPDLSPSSFAPNLPAGYTVDGDTTWSTVPASGWRLIQFYIDRGDAYVDTISGPEAPTSLVIRNRPDNNEVPGFPSQGHGAGWTVDQGNGSNFSTPRKGIFNAFVLRRNAGHIEEAQATKMLYPNANILNTAPVGAPDSGQYKWYLATQTGPFGGWNRNLEQNVGSPYVCNNETWYKVQVQMEYGSAHLWPGVNYATAVANGLTAAHDHVFRLWISAWDGSAWEEPVLTHEYTNLVFTWQRDEATNTGDTTTNGVQFTQSDYNVYRGGSGLPNLTAPQFNYFNRTLIASKAL